MQAEQSTRTWPWKLHAVLCQTRWRSPVGNTRNPNDLVGWQQQRGSGRQVAKPEPNAKRSKTWADAYSLSTKPILTATCLRLTKDVLQHVLYRVAQKSKLLYCVNSLLFLSNPVMLQYREHTSTVAFQMWHSIDVAILWGKNLWNITNVSCNNNWQFSLSPIKNL